MLDGKKFALQTSEVVIYENFQSSTKYYFSDGYEFDEENEVFKLKKVNLDPVVGTFEEMIDNYGTYPYTCVSTSVDGVCEVLLKINSWRNTLSVRVQYISYSSVDRESTRTNDLSSNAKTQIEDWYKTNIAGKKDTNGNLITDYIVDGTFCNDRSILDSSYNSGYLLAKHTYYGAYTRLMASNKTATLKCNNDIRDKFSNTTTKGNGLLEYPVALITADEVALAGGKSETVNENYYLKTGNYYWTMSPSHFNSTYGYARVWFVNSRGILNPWNRLSFAYGLRPVINLRSDILISSGDGSVENPYQLKLA